ncbi:MAG: hypothetical protein Q9210_004814 [Variospora velana]
MQDQHPWLSTFDVAKWRDNVAQAGRACKLVKRLPTSKRTPRFHAPTRPSLAAISANPQRYHLRGHTQAPPCYNYARKRKQQMDHAEDFLPVDHSRPTPKRRGRPPKDPSKQPGPTQRVPLNDIPSVSPEQSTNPSSSGIPSKRSRSRSQASKTFEQPKTTATIDLPYLASCNPHVERRSYKELLAKYKQLPEPVASLLSALTNIPHGVIPEALKPDELHTKMPTGTPLIYSADAASTIDPSTEKNTSDKGSDPKSVRKMIDWCLALALGYKDEGILEKAFGTIDANECSVNQSLSYIRHSPIFLDIEMKRKQPATDPEVELAIWASGALLKKLHHGWDTTLPMPAITIEGHLWSWYMFVPKMNGKSKTAGLVMLGPFPMGTTANLVGVWQIVYRLNTLITWGTTEYSQWFQNEVIGWARDRLGLLSEGDSSLSELYEKGMSVRD